MKQKFTKLNYIFVQEKTGKNEFTCITHNIDQNLKHINNAQTRREKIHCKTKEFVCVRKQVYGFHKFDINFVVFFLPFFAFHQILQ